MSKLTHFAHGKTVLFVSTKNLSYLRNTQEIALLKQEADCCTVLGSNHKLYFLRLIHVYVGLLKQLLTKKYDVVFFGFAPQLVFPLFAWCQTKHWEIGIDFFISMYDTLVNDRKKLKPSGFLARWIHKIDEYVLSHAQLVIADTNAHKTYFCSEFSQESAKFETLYLCADTSIYYPREMQRLPEMYGKFLVLYFGSVLPLQGVDVVLDAMKLCMPMESIHFIFIGPIGKAKVVIKSEYPHTTFFDWLSQNELAEKIALADLCLSGHFNALIDKASRTIAGKTYIYKAMRKPVVLGDNVANRELYKEQDGENYYVPMGDARALATLIIDLSTQLGR